ncbi:MAG TPA: hypothetical protein VFR67_09575 [Pilimelia sp.]|nr:hypothetical protein [Pilimelia sp.]
MAPFRLRMSHPPAMDVFDKAVAAGLPHTEAMCRAAREMARVAVRSGAGALTSSVRGGPIGINRIDLAVDQLVIAWRALSGLDPEVVRDAVERHRPAQAIAGLRGVGGQSTVAVVVRPRPDLVGWDVHAARLARQDQAAGVVPRPLPLPRRPGRRALAAAAAPAHARPGR